MKCKFPSWMCLKTATLIDNWKLQLVKSRFILPGHCQWSEVSRKDFFEKWAQALPHLLSTVASLLVFARIAIFFMQLPIIWMPGAECNWLCSYNSQRVITGCIIFAEINNVETRYCTQVFTPDIFISLLLHIGLIIFS